MKKIVVIISLAIMAIGASAQTIQEKKQMKALDVEIRRTQREVMILQNQLSYDYSEKIELLNKRNSILGRRVGLERDSVSRAYLMDSVRINRKESEWLAYKSISVDRTSVQYDIDGKQEKISNLEKEREKIFRHWATSTEVPKEITPRQLNRGQRANTLRREELVLAKVEANLYGKSNSAIIEPSGAESGYKVILANDYCLPINFVIRPINGGERKSVLLASKQKISIYLIPGVYSVSFMKSGTNYGNDEILTIDGSTHIYQGEECFNYAYMPRY